MWRTSLDHLVHLFPIKKFSRWKIFICWMLPPVSARPKVRFWASKPNVERWIRPAFNNFIDRKVPYPKGVIILQQLLDGNRWHLIRTVTWEGCMVLQAPWPDISFTESGVWLLCPEHNGIHWELSLFFFLPSTPFSLFLSFWSLSFSARKNY